MQRQEWMNVGAPLHHVATLVVPGNEISESHDVFSFQAVFRPLAARKGFLQLVDDEMSPGRQRNWRRALDADRQAVQVRSGDLACFGLAALRPRGWKAKGSHSQILH